MGRLDRARTMPGVPDPSTKDRLAERAGVDSAYVDRLTDLGLLVRPADGSTFTLGDLRRVRLLRGMEDGGLPLEGIATAVGQGDLSFDFLDSPSWAWYGGYTGRTYQEVSADLGVPIDVLLTLRESMGFGRARPDDLIHEEELEFLPVVKVIVDAGVDQDSLDRLVRVWGDSLRRMTEAAAYFYHTQIELPLLRTGMGEGQMMLMANQAVAASIAPLDRALVAMYHGHSEHTWLGNVIEAVEAVLERSGLHHPVVEPPAMSFVDLSGYTRLTEERGDAVAAEMASTLGAVVQRSASDHGGRAVKWLGDGVMLYFAEPVEAVRSALELAEAVPGAGLPQTHTGIDAGPVIQQDGDYFGRTVNTAARIAAHAGPGEVLVSDRVEHALRDETIACADLGLVELKGLLEPIRLHRARRAA
jgi:adenylate cyclase